jgi:2,3-bisphosphoglycerate-independent phosphoglycerate mutase
MKRGNGRLVGLVILDGWGLNPRTEGNAVRLARTPVMDRLLSTHPSASLITCGEAVGLPAGQMGNSEVGHLNLGAGRIVYQDLTRIDKAVADGDLGRNAVLGETLARARGGGTLHFIGLLSPGGVHSHERHLYALLRLAAESGIRSIRVHAFLDGRDTPPRSAMASIAGLTSLLASSIPGGSIATISGRYYAMDRDKRWDRTEAAYRAMVAGDGQKALGRDEAYLWPAVLDDGRLSVGAQLEDRDIGVAGGATVRVPVATGCASASVCAAADSGTWLAGVLVVERADWNRAARGSATGGPR